MENPKMAKKVAGFFAKKGNKALASHEYREAAGKEKDTPAIAKREMKALKGAPAAMKNYEKKEHMGMKYAAGGMTRMPAGPTKAPPARDGAEGMGGAMASRPMMSNPGPMRSAPVGRVNTMPMAKGGMAGCYAEGGMVKKPYKPTPGDLNEKSGGDQEMENRDYMDRMRKKAKPAPAPKPKMYAAGGMVRADGCASKGKTRGRFV